MAEARGHAVEEDREGTKRGDGYVGFCCFIFPFLWSTFLAT